MQMNIMQLAWASGSDLKAPTTLGTLQGTPLESCGAAAALSSRSGPVRPSGGSSSRTSPPCRKTHFDLPLQQTTIQCVTCSMLVAALQRSRDQMLMVLPAEMQGMSTHLLLASAV